MYKYVSLFVKYLKVTGYLWYL